MRIGADAYPLVLPAIRDPRLHVAAVVLTIHALGQLVFDFHVSVPQIVMAIATCFVIEVLWTFAREARVVWPASAMLTGSGVALVLRVTDQDPGDHWSFDDLHLFAAVAGLSLVSKYVLRLGDGPWFNPSNLGLVGAFVLLGSDRVEPLDFWWAPFGWGMAMAYAVIIGGGIVVTRRMGLLAMATSFWLALAAGLGVLAAVGHCITARWSVTPVCDLRFWWVIVTSPETLIFLFFMISDPKTIPKGAVARIRFGAVVGAVCVLLIAPARTEFGAKVGLLSGLVLCLLARPVLEPVLARGAERSRSVTSLAVTGALVVAVGLGAIAAGVDARHPDGIDTSSLPSADGLLPLVDPASLPVVTGDADALEFHERVADGTPQELGARFAYNLQVEALAAELDAPEHLRAVDHGRRRDLLLDELETNAAAGLRTVRSHDFETLHLVLARVGSQGGVRLAFQVTGSVTVLVSDDGGTEISRTREPLASTFVLLGSTQDRWFVVDEVEIES